MEILLAFWRMMCSSTSKENISILTSKAAIKTWKSMVTFPADELGMRTLKGTANEPIRKVPIPGRYSWLPPLPYSSPAAKSEEDFYDQTRTAWWLTGSRASYSFSPLCVCTPAFVGVCIPLVLVSLLAPFHLHSALTVMMKHSLTEWMSCTPLRNEQEALNPAAFKPEMLDDSRLHGASAYRSHPTRSVSHQCGNSLSRPLVNLTTPD